MEHLFCGFHICRPTEDETYAAEFFAERLVAPYSGNVAICPALAAALQPFSDHLRKMFLDHDASVFANE